MIQMNDCKFRSWFCVWNNPQDTLQGTPNEMAETALNMWIQDKPSRIGAVAYCISADGLIHFHMVLEDSNKARFSAIKSAFPKAHIEPTKGNKEQAENYITKKGAFAEKGEEVVYIARYGEIKGRQGQRRDFEILENMIAEGKTPNEIFDCNMSYRRYEKMVKDSYFRKRIKETPVLRDLKVYWHVGESGSGKSYTYKQLVDKYGEDEIYLLTDYENGGFDGYCGQKILFMDEFRGQIRFSTLLAILQGYKQQFHARFTNVVGLWEEVHITSVLPPDKMYNKMVEENRDLDTCKQLLRRITAVVYHYMEKGQFCKYEEYEYKNYDMLIYQATKDLVDSVYKLQPLKENEKVPF